MQAPTTVESALLGLLAIEREQSPYALLPNAAVRDRILGGLAARLLRP
jgi:hypothetical protein